MTRIAAALLTFGLCLGAHAYAQDIRGIEVCTAEKDMNRRTSCLQSNVQFLQSALDKATRDAQAGVAAANRELVAQRSDIAALKDSLAKMQAQLDELKKAKPAK